MSVKRKTIEIDATGMAPGRLASKVAVILQGKHKTTYLPYKDLGDKVVINNFKAVKFTGKKIDQKLYRHHTNHPGGLKEIPAKKMVADNPDRVILRAVAKMLPKNKLREARLRRIVLK